MKVFYVSYDVRENDNSKDLRDRLDKLGGQNVLESVWTLSSEDIDSIYDVIEKLAGYIGKNTGLVIVEVTDQYFHNTIEDPHEIDL